MQRVHTLLILSLIGLAANVTFAGPPCPEGSDLKGYRIGTSQGLVPVGAGASPSVTDNGTADRIRSSMSVDTPRFRLGADEPGTWHFDDCVNYWLSVLGPEAYDMAIDYCSRGNGTVHTALYGNLNPGGATGSIGALGTGGGLSSGFAGTGGFTSGLGGFAGPGAGGGGFGGGGFGGGAVGGIAINNPGGGTGGRDVRATVPEPSTLIILGMGTLGIAGYHWRRKKAAA